MTALLRSALASSPLLALTLAAPLAAQDLYVTAVDGRILAGDTVSGGLAPVAQDPGPLHAAACVGEALFVARPDGTVLRYEAGSGLAPLAQLPSDARALAADGGALLVGGSDGVVHRLDPDDGSTLGTLGARTDVTALVEYEGVRYAGSAAGVLSRETGSGTFAVFGDVGAEVVGIGVYEREVVVGTADGVVHLVADVSGVVFASHPVGAPLSGLTLHLKDVLATTADGRVLRLDRETGGFFDAFPGGQALTGLAVVERPAAGIAYCYGDDNCPCGNPDLENGCANSTGRGGYVLASGSASLSRDDLQLVFTHLPPHQPTILLVGHWWPPSPLGDGLTCLADYSLVRFPLASSGPYGYLTYGPGLLEQIAPQLTPLVGDDLHYQAWYRDGHGPCGSTFNLTNAYSIVLTP